MPNEYEADAKRAIAVALRELRERKGITPAQVSHSLGVSRSNAYRWEDGTATPTLSNLVGLAALYDVSLTEIVTPAEAAVAKARAAIEKPTKRRG